MTPVTHDLFSAAGMDPVSPSPTLPGLVLASDILDEAEERALIAYIEAAPLAPFRFQQWTGKRLTHSYGWTYDFETGGFSRSDPIPPWLEPVRARAACFAARAPADLVQALVTRYDPGAGIGWHRDRPVFEEVIGISLGAPASLRFRRRQGTRFDRAAARLAPRSIYHLTGEARHDWEHGIAPMAAARWSVTFRTLRGL